VHELLVACGLSLMIIGQQAQPLTRAELLTQASEMVARWYDSPNLFVREAIGATPDGWQDQALEVYPQCLRMALKACVNPGKSTLLCWIGWHFAATRMTPKIAVTSISWPNLRDNLWAEFAKWHRRSAWLQAFFTWTQTRIFANDNREEWWIAARTWDRSADAEKQGQTLSGLHADNIMALIDECSGIPDAVLSSAEGILAGGSGEAKEAHLVLAGNPTHLSGPLYRACNQERELWKVFEVTGDPDNPNRASRVDINWAREMVGKWGRDSAVVRAKVLGLFPLHATDALIGLDQFEDAKGRAKAPDGSPLTRGLKTLGVDVGRFGSDSTVVARRDGCFLDELLEWTGKDTEETADRVALIGREHDIDEIRVDDIGVGGGVTDKLRRRDLRARVMGVNVGEAPTKTGRDGGAIYANLKAQVNLEMQEGWFRPGLISIDPSCYDTPLVEEGTDIRYGFARGGKVLRVEDKDQFRKRHNGASPDHWDAVVLAFAELTPPSVGESSPDVELARGRFDPFAGRRGRIG